MKPSLAQYGQLAMAWDNFFLCRNWTDKKWDPHFPPCQNGMGAHALFYEQHRFSGGTVTSGSVHAMCNKEITLE